MDIANELLKATLAGVANGTVKPSMSQAAILEHAGLIKDGLLTPLGEVVLKSSLPGCGTARLPSRAGAT